MKNLEGIERGGDLNNEDNPQHCRYIYSTVTVQLTPNRKGYLLSKLEIKLHMMERNIRGIGNAHVYKLRHLRQRRLNHIPACKCEFPLELPIDVTFEHQLWNYVESFFLSA